MSHVDMHSEQTRLQNRNADFEAVNNSATFIFMVAVVAIIIAVPLALFF